MHIEKMKCVKPIIIDESVLQMATDVSNDLQLQEILAEYVFEYVISYSDYYENVNRCQWRFDSQSDEVDDNPNVGKTDVGYVFKMILFDCDNSYVTQYLDIGLKQYVATKFELDKLIGLCDFGEVRDVLIALSETFREGHEIIIFD